MRHKYRVVSVIKSNGQVDNAHNEMRVNEPHEGQIILVEKARTHRVVRWVFGIIIAIALIALILWMVLTSTTLSQMNSTVHQQSEYLSSQSTQLATIRAKLDAISQQLNQFSTYIKTVFETLRRAIKAH